ncbi:MAG: EamA family transporter, partial [Gemmataceae bacterium]|nr:EamA family transporter [Gemmataceae bacterium]
MDEGEAGAAGDAGVAPYLWMIAGCFVFAWMGQFAHLLAGRCDWRLVAMARASLACLFASCVVLATGRRLVVAGSPVLWMRSLAGSLSLLCTFFALANLRPGAVLALTNTFPIWVALLSWPLLGQVPGLGVWAAAACGVAGAFLIGSPQEGEGIVSRLAVALALVASFSSAVAMLGLN